MKTITRAAKTLLLSGTVLLLTGCFTPRQETHTRSSVVDFLDMKNGSVATVPATPHLRLPLRVGVAFTPAQIQGHGFSTMQRDALARDVAATFADLPYVSHIEIIPSTYLRPRGGFENLDQVANMFDIDVVVLLSYDQQTYTGESLAAFTYWTLIGAYTVPAEKNETFTLMDAAVYDIASRRLLFRAPGSSSLKSRSTLVANRQTQREDSAEGFQLAATELASNLKVELTAFNDRVRNAPETVQVSRRPGYSGMGSADGVLLLMALFVVAMAIQQQRRSA